MTDMKGKRIWRLKSGARFFFSDSRSLHIDTVRWAGDSQSLGGKCESRPPFREHSTALVCKRRRSKKNPILHPTDSDFRSRSLLGRLLASQRTSISISVVILSSVPFHPHRSLLPFHSNQLLESNWIPIYYCVCQCKKLLSLCFYFDFRPYLIFQGCHRALSGIRVNLGILQNVNKEFSWLRILASLPRFYSGYTHYAGWNVCIKYYERERDGAVKTQYYSSLGAGNSITETKQRAAALYIVEWWCSASFLNKLNFFLLLFIARLLPFYFQHLF